MRLRRQDRRGQTRFNALLEDLLDKSLVSGSSRSLDEAVTQGVRDWLRQGT